ncbi:MAG: Fe-S cluster assembly ATPase SufC [Microthrixaceae bacterium]|jgi:Fe-S cluster assembly ATP-binding protein
MSELVVTDLRAEVAGRPILTGVNLTVRSGEVHAIMGPNGSGKSTLSHVLMGRPGYTVTGGSVTLDGVDLIGLAPHERAQAGLFLGMQYPTEVPGVSIQSVLRESLVAAGGSGADLDADLRAEAARVGLDPALVGRSLNVDFSGGEKKRNETVQLALLRPKFAILDEIDSGLDVDALAQVSQRVEEATSEWGLGVIAVTHYNRLLEKLHADVVHIFAKGRILESGGPELAESLEESGYATWVEAAGGDEPEPSAAAVEDPFADPFADPLL